MMAGISFAGWLGRSPSERPDDDTEAAPAHDDPGLADYPFGLVLDGVTLIRDKQGYEAAKEADRRFREMLSRSAAAARRIGYRLRARTGGFHT
jgi:hypothetical protein